jgi:hypothetical protein
MKTAITIIIGLVLCAMGVQAGGVDDIELVSTVNSQTLAVITAPVPQGWVESVAVAVIAGSTGNVSVAVSNRWENLDSRTLVTTNGLVSDYWGEPNNAASRRYAVTDRDVLMLTVSNTSLTAREYRAVIRVERAK